MVPVATRAAGAAFALASATIAVFVILAVSGVAFAQDAVTLPSLGGTASDISQEAAIDTTAAYVWLGAAEAERAVRNGGAVPLLGERGRQRLRSGLRGVGKVARFAPAVIDGVKEIGEVGASVAEDDYAEAFVQFVGGVVNVGTGVIASGISDARAVVCASLGAWRGGYWGGFRAFGRCAAEGAVASAALSESAERAIERVIRRLTGGRRGPREIPALYAGGLRIGGGRRTRISVTIDGSQITVARSGSTAISEVGTSRTGGSDVSATTGTVYTTSRSRSTAVSRIGVGTGSGADINVQIDGPVVTSDAQLNVGVTDRSADIYVKGPIITEGRGGPTSTVIAGRTIIDGHVINYGGNLRIGEGACKAYRKGRCCVAIHRQLCVWSIVPPTKKGCPPRYVAHYGHCDLYSDFTHRIGR